MAESTSVFALQPNSEILNIKIKPGKNLFFILFISPLNRLLIPSPSPAAIICT